MQFMGSMTFGKLDYGTSSTYIGLYNVIIIINGTYKAQNLPKNSERIIC